MDGLLREMIKKVNGFESYRSNLIIKKELGL